MSAVLRLNLMITGVFVLALLLSLNNLISQASKDIEREVVAGVSFTHRVLAVAVEEPALLTPFLNGHTRHVRITLLPAGVLPDMAEDAPLVDEDAEEPVPDWFVQQIPGVKQFSDQVLLRFLADGRVLKVQADPSDELAEVWESAQQLVALFVLAAVLTNVAVWLGVRQGVKPLARFLAALAAIRAGKLDARLPEYSLPELKQLAQHFNEMATQLEQEQQDNRALTRQLMRLQEAERAHLARELHDDLGQYLAGIQAQAYLTAQAPEADQRTRAAQTIVQHCQTMQHSFRRLIQALHPVILDQMALADALQALAQHWQQQQGIECYCDISPLPALGDEQTSHIYRFVQEALNNVAKHANATRVHLIAGCEQGQICVKVADNGVGRDAAEPFGFGMRSMQERAHMLGGELTVSSVEQQGLSLWLRVPQQEWV